MKKLLILTTILILTGCQSLPFKEIKLGGGYKDFAGDITIVLDEEKTTENKSPVLEEIAGEEKRLLYTFDESELEKLLKKINDLKEKITGKTAAIRTMDSSPYRELRKELD